MSQLLNPSPSPSAPLRGEPSSPASPTGAAPHSPDIQDPLDAYRAQARRGRDPLGSNLALVNAQLLEIHGQVSQVLQRHLVRPDLELDDIRDISPELDQLLRFSRQVGRFADLEFQMRKHNDRSASAIPAAPVASSPCENPAT